MLPNNSSDVKLTKSSDRSLSFLERVSLSLRTVRWIRAEGSSSSISWTGRFQCLSFWTNDFHGNSKKNFLREKHYLKTINSFTKRISKFGCNTLFGIWIDPRMFFSGKSVQLISSGGRTRIQATVAFKSLSTQPLWLNRRLLNLRDVKHTSRCNHCLLINR